MYFRDIFSGVNGQWHRKSCKEVDELKNIDQNNYCSNYYDFSVTKYGVKWETLLRFWGKNGWINYIDLYGWFQWYCRYWFGRIFLDNKRKINRWKGVVSRFKSKSTKMIKDL